MENKININEQLICKNKPYYEDKENVINDGPFTLNKIYYIYVDDDNAYEGVLNSDIYVIFDDDGYSYYFDIDYKSSSPLYKWFDNINIQRRQKLERLRNLELDQSAIS